MIRIFLILSIPLLFAHCKSSKENQISAEDQQIIESFKKIQSETDLSDEEMMQAVKRYCMITRSIEYSINEGLMTMEDFKTFPSQVKQLRDELAEADFGTSQVCLGVLKAHKENKVESSHDALRALLALYYRDIRNRDEQKYTDFRKKVEDYATNDKKLAELLK